ncbi:MAG: AraC family transcriptional regulator [Anaerotignum sp.]|nr:AraC family transcriptional regulator [Anaerotignum sp.]
MDYLHQLEKAVIFIENNLDQTIRVEEVADIVGYSYYHFHRVFEAVLGESIGNYIRTRRLNRAANALLYTDNKVLDIAIQYQFETQESFSRAFKKIYSVSPGTYRKNRINTMIGNKKELTVDHLKHIYEGVTIHPVICQVKEKKLAGMRFQTSLRNNTLIGAWESFGNRVGEIKNRTEHWECYGICEASPDFEIIEFDENTISNHFIGTEVSSFDELPQGMVGKKFCGGKYAVFTHKGKIETLKMTYDYIWGTWLLCSGAEIDHRDDFELYDERFLGADNSRSEIDIYIPLK